MEIVSCHSLTSFQNDPLRYKAYGVKKDQVEKGA